MIPKTIIDSSIGRWAAVACGLALATAAATADPKLPRPDGKSADMSKPVQVFILMGQSNMFGFGQIEPEDTPGTLTYLTKKEGKFPHLIDDEGNWTVRNDVYYVQTTAGHRDHWLTSRGRFFGPELQFGHIMGHLTDAPILIIKACIGNRSLGWDLLPPGSERFEFEEKGKTFIYAGYKDSPSRWEKGTKPEPIGWYAGKQYDEDTANAKEAIANLDKYFPDNKGHEIAGFLWFQGHKDQNAAHAGRYELNLVNLIKALRKDFEAPAAKFVVATGCGNPGTSGFGKQIAEAQLAVDGKAGKYPGFKGNVASVDTRPFWRGPEGSPNRRAGHHYNHNAETYLDVGNAMGWAMAGLMELKK